MSRALEVVAPGPFTTVQDLGRPGLGGIGVGCSGAADRGAFGAANRLVGNPVGAACLELTFGGLHVRARGHLVVAVTGAPAQLAVDGRREPSHHLLHLRDGQILTVGTPTRGLRSYLAVRGGVDTAPVLGSRSTDVLAGLGPPPLRVGDVVPVGAESHAWPSADWTLPRTLPPGPAALPVRLGPRDNWFTDGAVDVLLTQTWTVTPQSNRVGARLRGEVPLTRRRGGELPSEAMVTGALQVPPDGQPVLFLADHPVTGGYPVIAVVTEVDLAAQLPPGNPVRFHLRQRH